MLPGYLKIISNFLEKRYKIIILILILAYAGQGLGSLTQESITTDEEVNISAGYSYWKTREIKLNVQSAPLIKLLGSAFILPLELTDFTKEKNYYRMDQRDFSRLFIYENNIDADKIAFYARLPFIVIGIFFGFYVYLFARKIFGIKSGLFALFLYSFSPSLIAQSNLVTSDISFIFFAFVLIYYLWCYFQKQNIKYALISGIVLGLALVSKFTALYLVPLVLIFFIINAFVKIRGGNFNLKKNIFGIIIIYFIAFIIIWIFYLPFGGKIEVDEKDIFSYIPLPHQYVEGAKIMSGYTESGRKDLYFMGEIRDIGWWYYYIVMFLIKVQIAFLIILLLSFWTLKNWAQKDIMVKIMILLTPLSLFLYFSFFNKNNVGFRHALIILPFLFLFAAPLVKLKNKKVIFLVFIFSFWHMTESLWIFPDYLMYFNQIAGGPNNAWKWSVIGDDWGQDFLPLKKYLKENKIKEFYLVDFKASRLRYFERDGIKMKKLECQEKPIGGVVSVRILDLAIDKNNCYQWLEEFKPIKKTGYSIWVYDFNEK